MKPTLLRARLPALLLVVLSTSPLASCGVTVHGHLPLGQTQSSAPWQTTTVRAAYNSTRLAVPEPPEGAHDLRYTIQLEKNVRDVEHNVSIPHQGANFWGFSLETSIVSQVFGKNSTHLNVPFLNLLANLEERAGSVVIRIGGNTQEYAIMVEPGDPRLGPGMSYGKTKSSSTGTTNTPSVLFTKEMLLSARKISDMLNVYWFIGIPFNDPINWRLDIAIHGQEIIGDRLLGMQAGNEPDFYVAFGRRPPPYGIPEYRREFEDLVATLAQEDRIPRKDILIGPSTSGQVEGFKADDVLNTGWLDDLHQHLYGVTVEHYSHDNCAANYGGPADQVKNPQNFLRDYLNHDSVVRLVSPYYRIAGDALKYGKPLMMFETNTASCGGFMGISNSYTAAIWGLDYGLQMAYANFTHGMIHVGGQNVFYNPFTSARTEQAAFNQWTVGPIFYSALIIGEILGKSNTARVKDLFPNQRYSGTPAYAVWEHDELSKVVLFNYMSDATGAQDVEVTLTVDAGVPGEVKVKYLLASAVTEKDNITWAGQTFGNQYEADGRLRGELNITTVPCSPTENLCRIRVPAPGVAVVFFDPSDPSLYTSHDGEKEYLGQAQKTFATTAHLKPLNTVTYEQAVLATSNGHKGQAGNENRARTNFEFRKLHSEARGRLSVGWAALLISVGMGLVVLMG